MVTYALEELPPDVQRLVRSLSGGESAVFTEKDRPVAQLSAVPASSAGAAGSRQFGFAEGMVIYMAEDFDAPVTDFGDL